MSIPRVQGQYEPILAPIPGLIMEVRVKVGDAVSAGQIVSILEAMKMENSLTTHVSGTVKEIRVEKGSEVSTGDVILIVG
jgi:glutaconyl-CoA decarboxylase